MGTLHKIERKTVYGRVDGSVAESICCVFTFAFTFSRPREALAPKK